MEDLSSLLAKMQEVCRHLFSSQELIRTLGQPEYAIAAFVVLNLVIFTETGLLFGFFLPGDSLLVTAGLVCYNTQQAGPGWNLPLLLATLCAAAIIGDSVGYWIGYTTGPKIFKREKSLFFAKDHLLKAQAFYEQYGGVTVVLARFMPLIRTFAPVVAGVGRMDYKRFLFFNVFGGIGWVCSMVLVGYFLTRAIDPLLQSLLGQPGFTVRDHVEKVIIVVVLVSVSPMGIAWLRSRIARTPKLEPVAVEAE